MVAHTRSSRTLSVLLHGQSHGNIHDEIIQSPDYPNKTITKRLAGTEFLKRVISFPILSHNMRQSKYNTNLKIRQDSLQHHYH
jgi:hypothetical protein